MSLVEQSKGRAASIPQQLTAQNPNIGQAAYRRCSLSGSGSRPNSSCCSSLTENDGDPENDEVVEVGQPEDAQNEQVLFKVDQDSSQPTTEPATFDGITAAHESDFLGLSLLFQEDEDMISVSHTSSSRCSSERGGGSSTTSSNYNSTINSNSISNSYSTTSTTSHSSNSSSVGAAPALPMKSSLRAASRLLTSIPLKADPVEGPMLPHAAPHQVYLSSEEDASSSADDFSDFGDDLDLSDLSRWPMPSSSLPRAQRHNVARVVTVVFHGRPSLINLPPRSASSSAAHVAHAAGGMMRTATEPTLAWTRSDSSSSSVYQNPPRSNSMIPSGLQKKRRQFLTVDPLAARSPDPDERDSPRGTRTPAAMLKRTLNLVKKRSKPLLDQASILSRDSPPLGSPMIPVEEVDEEEPAGVEPLPARKPVALGICRDSARPSTSSTTTTAKSSSSRTSSTGTRADIIWPLPPIGAKSRFRTGLSVGRQGNSVAA